MPKDALAVKDTINGEIVEWDDGLTAAQRKVVIAIGDQLFETLQDVKRYAKLKSVTYIYQLVASPTIQRALELYRNEQRKKALDLEKDGNRLMSEGADHLEGIQKFQAGATLYKLHLDKTREFGQEATELPVDCQLISRSVLAWKIQNLLRIMRERHPNQAKVEP